LEIIDIVKDIKNNEKYQNKINFIENIYCSVFNDVFNPEIKNSILNKRFEKIIYIDLYDEMIKERDGHKTFMKFSEIINGRDNVFSILRKNICKNFIENLENNNIIKNEDIKSNKEIVSEDKKEESNSSDKSDNKVKDSN